MIRHVRLAVLALFMGGGALAQNAVPLSSEDRQLLWEEALMSFDGSAYTYRALKFASRPEAEDCVRQIFLCERERGGRRLELTRRYNELPLAYRERIAALGEGAVSDPVAAANGEAWWVFSMQAIRPARFAGEVDAAAWLDQFAASALPAPSALKTRREFVARRALYRLREADELWRAMAEGQIRPADLDALSPNGATPLLQAIHHDHTGLLAALLAAGASPDRCGVRTCPLALAVALQRKEAVRLLLKNKADPDGGRTGLSPLMAASVNGDRELAQWLLDAGADPLASRDERIGGLDQPRSVLFYAAADNPAYLEWLQRQVSKALSRDGAYRWSAWIEQGGARWPVQDGATLVLGRLPFRLVVRTNERAFFRVLASPDATLLDRSRNPVLRRELLSDSRIGAANEHSKYLAIFEFEGEDAVRHSSIVSNEWRYSAEADEARGTTRRLNKGEVEYVHEVEEFITASRTLPIGRYQGDGLAVLMGPVPPLGAGADYFRPARIRLVFRPRVVMRRKRLPAAPAGSA